MVYSFVYFSSLVLRFCPFVAHPPPASSLLRRLSCPCAHLVQEGAAGGRKPNSFALDDFYAHHLIEFKNRPSPISPPPHRETVAAACGNWRKGSLQNDYPQHLRIFWEKVASLAAFPHERLNRVKTLFTCSTGVKCNITFLPVIDFLYCDATVKVSPIGISVVRSRGGDI